MSPAGSVIFETLVLGRIGSRTIRLRNIGVGPLTVGRIEMVDVDDGEFKVEFSGAGVFNSPPVVLTAGDEQSFVELDVTYRPRRAGPDSGYIRIESDDLLSPVTTIALVGRGGVACVRVSPADVDFGPGLVGASEEMMVVIQNCGDIAFDLTELELSATAVGPFDLVDGPLGPPDSCPIDGGLLCSGAETIPPGESRSILLRFTPADSEEYEGSLTLRTTAPGFERLVVNLRGVGRQPRPPGHCAEARIAGSPEWGMFLDMDDALETIPLKTVELRLAEGRGRERRIAAYRWSVVQRPEDSTARLLPHEGAPRPIFFLDLAGLYIFELEVTHSLGVPSDPPCRVVVEAIPDEDIHIQLVWDTPDDPDQTDKGFGAGADLDLHLLHPLGDWFCLPRDVYYAWPNPDWGVPFDRSDDPSLDIDDTDGAGPENINLNYPENNRVYRVGVHYFNDHGYGPSFATIRIFIQGRLRFELADKRLKGTDVFWDVGTIAWPSAEITPIDVLTEAPPNEGCR